MAITAFQPSSETLAGINETLGKPQPSSLVTYQRLKGSLCRQKKASAYFSETRVAFEFMSCSIRSPNSQRKADTEPVDAEEEGFELRVCLTLKKYFRVRWPEMG